MDFDFTQGQALRASSESHSGLSHTALSILIDWNHFMAMATSLGDQKSGENSTHLEAFFYWQSYHFKVGCLYIRSV